MHAFCWSCPNKTFASQYAGFVQHVDGNLQRANFNFTHGNFYLFVSKLKLA